VHTSQKYVGKGHPILATPPAFIRNLLFPILPNSFDIWYTQPMPSQNLCNGPSEPVRSWIQEGFLGAGGVIDSFPLSISESFAIVKCCEIRSLSHAIDVRPFRFSEAASPAS
jgi:hypothetical protein